MTTVQDRPDGAGDDWFGALLGTHAAEISRAYGVRCLHYAHSQAAWRYRLATWTNNNTYGIDRFHCLTSTFGAAIEARVPGAKVHFPTDEWGSPFLVEANGSALYVWRYGESSDEPYDSIPPPRGKWLVDQIFHGPGRDQGVLEFPNLAPIPLARIAVLAYAGNRTEGLVRAFIGLPYLDNAGSVCWRRREELDLDAGRQVFGLPGVSDDDLPARHSFVPGGRVFLDAPQPAFDLSILDKDAGLDLSALFTDTTGDGAAPQEAKGANGLPAHEPTADDENASGDPS